MATWVVHEIAHTVGLVQPSFLFGSVYRPYMEGITWLDYGGHNVNPRGRVDESGWFMDPIPVATDVDPPVPESPSVRSARPLNETYLRAIGLRSP